jgi:hypothetical protein
VPWNYTTTDPVFVAYVHNVKTAKPKEQREGQWAFNSLLDIRPDIAEKARATEVDPFYNDTILYDFLYFVDLNWEKP